MNCDLEALLAGDIDRVDTDGDMIEIRINTEEGEEEMEVNKDDDVVKTLTDIYGRVRITYGSTEIKEGTFEENSITNLSRLTISEMYEGDKEKINFVEEVKSLYGDYPQGRYGENDMTDYKVGDYFYSKGSDMYFIRITKVGKSNVSFVAMEYVVNFITDPKITTNLNADDKVSKGTLKKRTIAPPRSNPNKNNVLYDRDGQKLPGVYDRTDYLEPDELYPANKTAKQTAKTRKDMIYKLPPIKDLGKTRKEIDEEEDVNLPPAEIGLFKQVMNVEGVRQQIFAEKNKMIRADDFGRKQLEKVKMEFDNMSRGSPFSVNDYKEGDYFFVSDNGDEFYIRILKRTPKGLEYILGRVGGGNPEKFKDRLKMMEFSMEGDRKPKLTLYNRNLPDNYLRPQRLFGAVELGPAEMAVNENNQPNPLLEIKQKNYGKGTTGYYVDAELNTFRIQNYEYVGRFVKLSKKMVRLMMADGSRPDTYKAGDVIVNQDLPQVPIPEYKRPEPPANMTKAQSPPPKSKKPFGLGQKPVYIKKENISDVIIAIQDKKTDRKNIWRLATALGKTKFIFVLKSVVGEDYQDAFGDVENGKYQDILDRMDALEDDDNGETFYNMYGVDIYKEVKSRYFRPKKM